MNCSSAVNVEFSSNLTEIGISAFEGCASLTDVKLPKLCVTLGNRVFFGTNIKTIDLNNVEIIGKEVCASCPSLISAEINTKWTSIPYGLFSNDIALETVKAFGLERLSNIVVIDENAFKGCIKLKNLDLPSLVIVGKSAFMGCEALESICKSDYAMSLSIEDFGEDCFNGCVAFVPTLESNVVSQIGARAFKGTSIKSVDIQEITGTTLVIGNNAFEGCTITSVNIPLDCTVIKYKVGNGVFKNCIKLTGVVYGGDAISDEMFSGCTSIKNIDVSDALTIGSKALYNCSGITKLLLPEVEVINTNAFELCDSISEININDNAQFNGVSHFKGCSNITGEGLNFTLDVIPAGMFAGCYSMTEFSKISSASKIGTYAFDGCTNLYKNINAPLELNAVEIGEGAFKNSGILSVDLGDNITTVGKSAFEGCTNLNKVIRSDSDNWTVINSNTFKNCISLKEVYVPIVVNSIGSSAFNGCTSLAKVEIKEADSGTEDVLTIGADAFKNTGLSFAYVPKRVTSISRGAIGFVGTQVDGTFTMMVDKDSVAEEYAIKYGIALIYNNKFENPTNILGDANNDGEVAINDLVLMKKYNMGMISEGICIENCDIVKDNKINSFDITALKRLLLS